MSLFTKLLSGKFKKMYFKMAFSPPWGGGGSPLCIISRQVVLVKIDNKPCVQGLYTYRTGFKSKVVKGGRVYI